MKTIPEQLTATVLAALASPTETHAVRVVVRNMAASAPYTLRGKRHRYVVERDNTHGVHSIDIPVSLWMSDIPAGPYGENLSLCHDLQAHRVATKSPLIFHVVPWKHATAEPEANEAPGSERIEAFRRLLEVSGAPDPILNAFRMVMEDPCPDDELVAKLREITQAISAEPDPAPVEVPKPDAGTVEAPAPPAAPAPPVATKNTATKKTAAKKTAKRTTAKSGEPTAAAIRQRKYRARKRAEAAGKPSES